MHDRTLLNDCINELLAQWIIGRINYRSNGRFTEIPNRILDRIEWDTGYFQMTIDRTNNRPKERLIERTIKGWKSNI